MKSFSKTNLIFSSLMLILLAFGCNKTPAPSQNNSSTSNPTQNNQQLTNPAPTSQTPAKTPALGLPMDNGLSRVTKKPFGIFVSPSHSPVSPEKFTGFHTGVDFETTTDEANTDVEIRAVCDGTLLVARHATGYGGVMVQSCKLDGQDVTIIYGHIRLTSVVPKVGDKLKTADKLAVLGTGYSTETDGERKHLHLGIHKGTSINILGYVQKQSQLSDWLNALDYMK